MAGILIKTFLPFPFICSSLFKGKFVNCDQFILNETNCQWG